MLIEMETFHVDTHNWCLYRHLCILPERFGKRPMNRKFDQCASQKECNVVT